MNADGLVTSGSDGYTSPADLDGNGTPDFIEVGTSPSITEQPVNVIACLGCTLDIVVTSSADTYQWQWFNGSAWEDLTDGSVYSGTTTSTLTLTNPPLSLSASHYQVITSNSAYACGTTISNSIFLTIPSSVISNKRMTYRVKI